jgi:hypothetical protein
MYHGWSCMSTPHRVFHTVEVRKPNVGEVKPFAVTGWSLSCHTACATRYAELANDLPTGGNVYCLMVHQHVSARVGFRSPPA